MTTAYRLWEMIERSKTGPHIEEDEFLPRLFTPTLKKLIKKYEIRYDPQTPVPADDNMADRIWQAAWELVREVGVYNTDTHRMIRVSNEEIKEALYTGKTNTGWVPAKMPFFGNIARSRTAATVLYFEPRYHLQ